MNTTIKDFYFSIDKPGMADFKDRGSSFIGYAFPLKTVEAFKERLNEIKKAHPKATHHCFAYRIGLDGNNFRSSDDGEPSGTAGRPILSQIDGRELVNTLVIVVRYFGGTLLGVPGLINAYRTTAALALQMTPVVQKTVEEDFYLQFDYTQMNDVMLILKQYQCRIEAQEVQLFCRLKIAVPKNRLEELAYKLGCLRDVELIKTEGKKGA